MQLASKKTSIGIIANPYSSRDIRRFISSATSIQTVERANMIERIIVSLAIFGIDEIYMMPSKSSISAYLLRNLSSHQKLKKIAIPDIQFLDIPITSTAQDSALAANILHKKNVDVILVLGGDGTHRVVAKEIGDIPMASISTGTNNAFPKFYEATLVGMAIGLYLNKFVTADATLNRNKIIHVIMNGNKKDIALVDLAITNDLWLGARALWHMQNLKELYLSFCEPTAIGMSSIGGLLNSVPRSKPYGLKILTSSPEVSQQRIICPIAPGRFEEIGISSSERIELDTLYELETSQGVIALDGEREIEFTKNDSVFIELKNDGPMTIDMNSIIELASKTGALINKNDFKKNDLIYQRNKYLEIAV